jgi:WhiB family redox-sensing transcriptional regulator
MPRIRDGATLPAGYNGHAIERPRQAATWKQHGLCVGLSPALFYPGAGDKGRRDAAAARKICAGCPVRMECLAFALSNGEEFGIWGGATERERRFMRRMLNRVKTGRAIGDVA